MPTLIVHHNDNDGLCSALVAESALKELAQQEKYDLANLEFFETNYGQDLPDVAGRNVYILDFSYPRETIQAMHNAASFLWVIDHHKTAAADLSGLDYCTYAIDKSGCQLTAEHFGYGEGHWLVEYVADRDLWKWQLENSREINAALASYPHTIEEWERLWKREPGELITEGAAILRYQNQVVEVLCSKAEKWRIGDHEVPVVNSPVLQSEIGQRLAEGNAFGAVFFDQADGTRTYSLRSTGDFDVSAVAKQFGGGGHTRAAGFTETRKE